MTLPSYLTKDAIRELCRRAIAEDVGSGDATTLAIVPEGLTTEAHFVTRQACVVCGLPVIATFFEELNPSVKLATLVEEGTPVQPGTRLATVSGDARAILTGERPALNLLQRMSGSQMPAWTADLNRPVSLAVLLLVCSLLFLLSERVSEGIMTKKEF